MAALLAHVGPRPGAEARQLHRAREQAVARDPATGRRTRQIFGADHPVSIARVELPAGGREDLPAPACGHAHQLVWVQAGELVVAADGERHALLAGDCLALAAATAVSVANEGVLACTFAVVSARG